jgi:hypothetical protein
MIAVPADVSCAVPMTAGPVQYVAEALQKVTTPAVTGDGFETAAVNVTTVPDVTEADDSVSVTAVPGLAAAVGGESRATLANKMIRNRSKRLGAECF